MTQITVTLEKGADANLINKILENVKGVLRTKISTHQDAESPELATSEIQDCKENKEWLKTLDKLYNSVDRSAIDIDDEKTRYVLSR